MMASFEIVQFRLLFREAAGRLNTALGRPADFPRRVLYSCAPPGHKPSLSRNAEQWKTYRREKAALTVGSGFRLEGRVQHLRRNVASRTAPVNTKARRTSRNTCTWNSTQQARQTTTVQCSLTRYCLSYLRRRLLQRFYIVVVVVEGIHQAMLVHCSKHLEHGYPQN